MTTLALSTDREANDAASATSADATTTRRLDIVLPTLSNAQKREELEAAELPGLDPRFGSYPS